MKLKKTFVGGKLNLDVDERLLPEGQYPDAQNIRVIETNNANYGAAQNVKGNLKLTDLGLTNATTIGSFADGSNQKLYWFVTSDEKDMVLEYDFRNSITSVVLESTAETGVLKFDKNSLITGVVKIVNEDYKKDLLAWTDDNTQPKCVNIERAKTYGLNGFEEEDILLIKKPPKYAPNVQLTYTNTFLENYLKDKFFSFGYRYKYLDGEYSAISSYSSYAFAPENFDLDYQTMDNKGMQNAFNAVNIIFNTGDKRVTDVELIFRESNSNTLYLIESFNKEKEMWSNNEEKSFKFFNSKKYKALPDDELYRSYDNVPLSAKALEVIGNRLVFGNYVEGYDLVNTAGEEINVDYDLSLSVNTLEGLELPTTITFSSGGHFSIDLSGIELKKDHKLNIQIYLKETTYNKGSFGGNFNLILNKDYSTVQDLFDDQDFKTFVESIMTTRFIQNYNAIAPLDSNIDEIIGFTSTISGNVITINAPKIVYVIDDTPEDVDDNPDNTHVVVSDWAYLINSNSFYFNIGVYSSLKSNRSLEVGMIYMDKFNRSTTALTDSNNTIYIPQDNAIYQNKLVVNVNSRPPSFATKYKFVIKQNKGIYYTIYSNFVYKDELYAWFKLEGNNKNKVKEGDYIIVKADPIRTFRNIISLKVLEVRDQPKNFLDQNTDFSGNILTEQAGVYMKVKAEGFSINAENNKVFGNSANASSGSSDFYPTCYVDLFTYYEEGEPSVPKEIKIPIGSRITLKFDSSFHYKDGWSSHKYEKDFLVLKDYVNFEAWYNDSIADIVLLDEQGHNYKDGMQLVRSDPEVASFYTGDPSGLPFVATGKMYLSVKGHESGGTKGRAGYVDASVTIVTSQGFFIFETEAENSDIDVYYETSQTFDIIDNKHRGNKQNQSSSTLTVEKFLDKSTVFLERKYFPFKVGQPFSLKVSDMVVGGTGDYNVAIQDSNGDYILVKYTQEDELITGVIEADAEWIEIQLNSVPEITDFSANVEFKYGTIHQPAIVELDFFNCYVQGNGAESYQYLDSFNGNFINIDSRPTSTSLERYKRVRRFADLTYSEPYNANTNINGLNEFNLSKANYKDDIDKKYGFIQKLYSRDNDILVFQEDKVSKVFYGKDLLYNTDGTSNLSAIEEVLGNQLPFAGEYGISRSPESFSFNGNYIYFADPKRGAVLRLAGDGINEISSSGMRNFFKDSFKDNINNRRVGSFDPNHDEYVINQSSVEDIPKTYLKSDGSVIKNNFVGEFVTYIDYSKTLGDCGFNYTTNGKPVNIVVEWGGIIQHDITTSNLSGTLLFDKTSRFDNIVKITVTASTDNTNVSLTGVSPEKQSGSVYVVVTNSPYYKDKNYSNRFKYVDGDYTSPFKTVSGSFKENIVSSFERFDGIKGEQIIPYDNSDIVMEVYYNSQEQSLFQNGGRFGYLISDEILDESDIATILNNMVEVPFGVISNENGSTTITGVATIGEYENIYLVYDYGTPAIAVDDFYTTTVGGNVLCVPKLNDINAGDFSVIVEDYPVYGTIEIDSPNIFLYEHDGSTLFLEDKFTYHLSNGIINSNTATVNINLTEEPEDE